MTSDAILVLQCLFQTIWKLFTAWRIPGTNVTPAAAFLFFLCAAIGLKFMGRVIGIGVDLQEYVEAREGLAGFRSARSMMRGGVGHGLNHSSTIHASGHIETPRRLSS